MKKFYQLPLQGYQYLSRLFPPSCRYYPSCSEYAKWQFAFNAPHKAFVQSGLRILRCNQLFDGGIDYPLIDYTPPHHRLCKSTPSPIVFWLVPHRLKPHSYYVVKNF